MSHFSEMEWNPKWDWENLVSFGSKATESPKKLQLTDWMIVDDGEIHPGPFNLSRIGVNNNSTGSDGGHNSSAKSSKSASTDSSTKDSIQMPNFRFSSFEGSSRNSQGTQIAKTSPSLEASVGSAEPLIGLRLGKRTYFENSGSVGTDKSTSLMPNPSSTTLKKTKSSTQNGPICCQVEGCNTDLSTSKEYHRKHRVCDSHSKCPKVIVGGVERRFCQQCSRFHGLCEFDEKKRSCRRRLSDHNARRRKPQQETIQFNSSRLSSSFCGGGGQQMSFLLNNPPLIHSRTPANAIWDGACNPKFTLTKGYPLKSNGDGTTDGQLHMQGIKLPNAINLQNGANGFLASKNSTSDVFSPGSKGSLISSLDAAPDRALSLLSSNSWDSCEPESVPLHHPMHENDSNITHPMIHAIPEGVPLSSSEFWLSGQQSTHPHIQSLATNTHFQEIQLFKSPYEADFYSNILN